MDERRLIFHCPGMAEGEKIPLEHTGRGADRSPEFLLENLSPQAKTLAVTLEDLSHPIRNFTHWVIWNIPAADRIPPDIPPGASVPSLGDARQGLGYGLHRYAGPKPPRGKRHFYRFSERQRTTSCKKAALPAALNKQKAKHRFALRRHSL